MSRGGTGGGEGFEIRIGDEGDTRFWAGLFAKVGDVDVIPSVTERLQDF